MAVELLRTSQRMHVHLKIGIITLECHIFVKLKCRACKSTYHAKVHPSDAQQMWLNEKVDWSNQAQYPYICLEFDLARERKKSYFSYMCRFRVIPNQPTREFFKNNFFKISLWGNQELRKQCVFIFFHCLLTKPMHSSFLNKQYFHFIAIYSHSLKHKDQTQHLIKLSFIKNDKIIGKNISAPVCKIEKAKQQMFKAQWFWGNNIVFSLWHFSGIPILAR